MAISVAICLFLPEFTEEQLRLQILIPVVAVFVLQPSLGASIEMALHIGAGTLIGTMASAAIIYVLRATFTTAIVVVSLLAALIGFVDLPPTVKRFGVGLAVIALVSWGAPSPVLEAALDPVSPLWAARVAASAAVGMIIGCAVAALPPAAVTATGEVWQRLAAAHAAHGRALAQTADELLRGLGGGLGGALADARGEGSMDSATHAAPLGSARFSGSGGDISSGAEGPGSPLLLASDQAGSQAIVIVMTHDVLHASRLQRLAHAADHVAAAGAHLSHAGVCACVFVGVECARSE